VVRGRVKGLLDTDGAGFRSVAPVAPGVCVDGHMMYLDSAHPMPFTLTVPTQNWRRWA
jgi:hypothetical protein